jgi:diadenosine tetraphosphate (Ap4A) HIT family hydrolase
MNYGHFTSIDKNRIIYENDLVVGFFDAYPIAEGHSLVIPKNSVKTIFDLAIEEQQAVWSAVQETRNILSDLFNPDAFNIGINDGLAAGQTIQHAHIHIIPRYQGDKSDPRGGIRWIFPSKAKYWND